MDGSELSQITVEREMSDKQEKSHDKYYAAFQEFIETDQSIAEETSQYMVI